MDSREKYLSCALDLFSQTGYYGVSVRDISNKLGVRESALYKHFKSKAHILEEIIKRAGQKLELFQNSIVTENLSVRKVLTDVYIKLFTFYTEDDYMNKFYKIMLISQYENEEAGRRYEKMFVSKTLNYYENLFQAVITQKAVEKADAKLMAYELYSVFYLLLQEYCGVAKLSRQTAIELLNRHICNFLDRYDFLEE